MATNCSQERPYQQVPLRNPNEDVGNTEEDETSSSTQDQHIFQYDKSTVKIIVWFVKLLLFCGILTCLVLSKLTILKIFADLYVLSNFSIYIVPENSTNSTSDTSLTRAANLYWMLFFIIMIPNLIAWIRAILNGLLTKSPSHPWPKKSAVLIVSELSMYSPHIQVFGKRK